MLRKLVYSAAAGALTAAAAVGLIATNGSADPSITTAGSTTTAAFSFTGATETFVVPAGVTSITVDGFGAQGGDGGTCIGSDPADNECGSPGTGGLGAHATSTVSVTPGETLTIVVGGQGGAGADVPIGNECAPPAANGGAGGFGGGADGGTGGCPAGSGGGGGGATAVLRGTTPLLVAAGGGGGSGAGASDGPAIDGVNGGASGTAGASNTADCGGQGGGAGTAATGGAGGAGGAGCTADEVLDSNGNSFSAQQAQCTGAGADGAAGLAGDLAFGGTGGAGAIDADIQGAGGGGGGGGVFGGGGGGGGGANCQFIASGGGGGGGGASLGATVVDGVNDGNGSLTITFATPAAAPAAVTVTPRFTG